MRISDWSSDVCSPDLVAIADSSLDTVCCFRERNQLMMKQDARWIAAFRDLAENRFEIKLWDVGRGRYPISIISWRTEAHTSELQSLMRHSDAVFGLYKQKQIKLDLTRNCHYIVYK